LLGGDEAKALAKMGKSASTKNVVAQRKTRHTVYPIVASNKPTSHPAQVSLTPFQANPPCCASITFALTITQKPSALP
jgi:hypothetical protein